MFKILVFNVPAHGHVNPTLPVVRELVSRGEQVTYYLTDEFEPQIRHTGATFRRIDDLQMSSGPPPGVTALGQTDPAMMRQMMAAFFPRMIADGLRLVPRLVDQVRAEDADCVVYDPFCSWGRALARILALPAVTFVPSYAMTENFPLVGRLSSIFEDQTSPEAEEAKNDLREVSRQLHDHYGLVPLRLTDPFIPAEALNIVTMPRAFQPDEHVALDERYVFVGPSISPRSDASGLPLDLLADNSTLYVSLGTVFNANPAFFDACFDAFADSDWQVVLSVGTNTDPSTLDRTPDNFLVRPHVPQLEVLEHTDVFVTHGGMNSVMEAIYYGVPMVVVPQQPEQAMTAARVAELGLGVALEPGQVTADALRDAVTTISGDAGYRNRIAHMQKAARDAGGYLRAADVIQQFGQTQPASVSGPADRPALLRGQSIVLRPLRAADVERVIEIQAEPGVARWWGPPNEAELRRQADGSADEKAFAIEREGEIVGLIQYHEENEPDFHHAGIDVFIAGGAQGHGLGTDAVRTLARYLIDERGHHRLTIDPAADNAAAIRAYEKVGFRAVGVMREYWRSPDGTWRDGLLMDLLARELDLA